MPDGFLFSAVPCNTWRLSPLDRNTGFVIVFQLLKAMKSLGIGSLEPIPRDFSRCHVIPGGCPRLTGIQDFSCFIFLFHVLLGFPPRVIDGQYLPLRLGTTQL